jgi:uncharacterized protein YdeI (YjbR/CyaY-like superfamily)
MEKRADLDIYAFDSQAGWEAWLASNHRASKGIWLKIAKKASGIASVDYQEALESALCYGWIDGQKASLDENYWLQKFSPRASRSNWSKVNREKAEELIASGKMGPEGLRQVELAKADGRWEKAYASQSKIEIPDDLQKELEQHPEAQAFFKTLDSRNRYAILYRLQTAKKPETRAARLRKFVEMLSRGEKIYP